MENTIGTNKKNVIIGVEPDSIAEELGIEPGDILLEVNGKKIEDVFDYRYIINDEYVELLILTKQGEECLLEIEKYYDEDIGIIFENGLMDNAKRCSNKCIFCFIDQLPKGMRNTLYFKDDDSRLSFLQGNYVTLTNMKKSDVDRIIYYHMSPINISVHTTDIELRKKLLGNKNAGNVLEYMEAFYKAKIDMNIQVVLMNGINDGKILDKAIQDCSKYYPYAKSMSVVPVGLTAHRDGLYNLEPFEKADSIKVIKQLESWQNKLLKTIGTRFVFPGDEFYVKSEIETPKAECYEDFSQYENGVGMLSLLESEFKEYIDQIKQPKKSSNKTVSIATGEASSKLIKKLSNELMENFKEIKINVYTIKNNFFGGHITVSGLLCGKDIIQQLKSKELGEYLMLPESLLRNGTQTLLDDIEISDIERELKTRVVITRNSGKEFIDNILNPKRIFDDSVNLI